MGVYIGLRMGGDRVDAVALEISAGRVSARDYFSSPHAGGESLVSALKECSARMKSHSAVWTAGIPASEFSFRHVSFPFKSRKAIRAALPFELEAVLPYSAEEMETSFIVLPSTGDETKALACAIRKERLAYFKTALAEAGIAARVVAPDVAGLPSFLTRVIRKKVSGALLVANADGGELSMCYMGPDGFVDFCAAEADARETGRFLASFETKPQKAFVGGSESARMFLPPDLRREEWKREAELALGGGFSPEKAMLPLGLSALGSYGDSFNFAVAAVSAEKLSSALRFAAAGLACGILFWLGFLLYGNRVKAEEAGRIRAEMNRIYLAAVPDGKPVKPELQLRQKLEELERKMRRSGAMEAGRADLLWALKLLSEALPENPRVVMEEVIYGEDGITLHGRTDRFESVTLVREKLSAVKIFKNVDVTDSKASADRKAVNFTIRIGT